MVNIQQRKSVKKHYAAKGTIELQYVKVCLHLIDFRHLVSDIKVLLETR